MRPIPVLLCAALGCASGLERTRVGAWVESDGVSLSPTEIWDLEWERRLPEIRATPLPEVPPEFAAPELAGAFRKGLRRGRDWALAEGLRASIVCAFPKTDLERAASAGFDAGRGLIAPWCARVQEDTPAVLMVTRRPSDLELRGSLPVILCFTRNTEGVAATAARESRRAVVGVVYSQDYAAVARRPDVLRALLARALHPARPGALYLAATSEARESFKTLDLPGSWRGPDALDGEPDAVYLERVFRALP